MLSRLRFLAACLVLAVVRPAAGDDSLSLSQAVARVVPDAERLRLVADLERAAVEIAAGAGLLREAPTVGLEGGPRRTAEGARSSDLGFSVELPLAAASGSGRAARRALDEARLALVPAADVELRLRAAEAFLEAWRDAGILLIRRDEAELLKKLRDVTRARVENGAEAAFQLALVSGELAKARTERDELAGRAAKSHTALEALVPGAHDAVLADPETAGGERRESADTPRDEARLRAGLLWRAVETRAALESAVARLDLDRRSGRFSLVAGARKEGEERAGTLGATWRLPLFGQGDAFRALAAREDEAIARAAKGGRSALLGRFRAALAALDDGDLPDDEVLKSADRALTARAVEGKDRPSDSLLLRRQLLEARIARIERQRALAARAAEVAALLEGVSR